MKAFRVLLIAPGGNFPSQQFAKWLLDNQWEVYFLDAVNPFPKGYSGFHFISYPYRGDRKLRHWIGSKWGGLLSAWLNAPILWLIWLIIKPDLVHVHFVDHRAYQSVIAGHRPLVLSVWGSDINYQFLPDADPEYKKMIGFALSKANLIFVNAKDILEKCNSLAGKPLSCEYLSFGVNCTIFTPGYADEKKELGTQYNIPDNAFVFLSIRGWNRFYNHDLILEAFLKSYTNFKYPAFLVFTRYSNNLESRSLQDQLLGKVKQLKRDETVIMLDEFPHSEMPVLYNFADAIINYPHVDAFPVTFLEAAACEKEVISCRLPSYVGSFAEQYFHMIEPDDVDMLSQAMLAMVNDHKDDDQNLRNARQYVIDHFDESISVRQMLDAYNRLI